MTNNKYECKIVEVTDGDTIKAEIIVKDFNVQIIEQVLRAFNYDAYESSYRRHSVKITSEEIQKGKLAKNFLIDLCKTHKLYIEPKGFDVYGRRLCIFLVTSNDIDFIDLATIMRQNGFTRS